MSLLVQAPRHRAKHPLISRRKVRPAALMGRGALLCVGKNICLYCPVRVIQNFSRSELPDQARSNKPTCAAELLPVF